MSCCARVLLLQTGADCVQVRLSLANGNTGFESTQHLQVTSVSHCEQVHRGVELPVRHNVMRVEPDLKTVVLKTRWHHSDQAYGLAANRQRLANELLVAGKPLLPIRMADDGYAWRARKSIRRLKDASLLCLDSQEGKEIRGDN